jgi:hypothetical protein
MVSKSEQLSADDQVEPKHVAIECDFNITVVPRYTSLIRSRSLDLTPNRTYTKRIFPIRNKGKIINPFPWKKSYFYWHIILYIDGVKVK